MIKAVKLLISKDFAEIKSTPLSLELLKVYSILYLNGRQPSSCEASLYRYYQQLIRNGTEKAQNMQEKTNKCNKKGLIYVGRPLFKDFDLQNLSDKDANSLIKLGILKKSDFKVMPAEVKDKQPKEDAPKEQPKPKTATPKVKVNTPKGK